MSGDWVKLHRSVMEHAIWQDDWHVRLFIWCILKANFAEKKVFGVELKKGQFITGKITASDELGVSASKWFRGIEKLVEYGCIMKEANRERTTITVCNYETYQADTRKPRTASEPRAEPERTASEPRAEPREERNNSKNSLSLSNSIAVPKDWNTPQFWEAVQTYKQVWFNKNGQQLPDIELSLKLKQIGGLGWSVEKVIRSIEKAASGRWERFFDPDEQAPQARVLPAKRKEPQYELLRPKLKPSDVE